MATEKGSPSLPCDLLREVLARCDHETLVHCAVSSRLLCHCMLDDLVILRRCTAGFAPSLLLGVFDSLRATGRTRFVESPAPTVIPREPIRSFLSDNADLLRCFHKPVAVCHGGLLVLRRYRCCIEPGAIVDLCICNPMTGHRCFLPSPELHASSVVILTGDNGSPFQLLAVDQVYEKWGHTMDMDYHVRSQLFSSPGPFPAISPGGEWGPVRRIAPDGPDNSFKSEDSPLVINRVAYWLNTTTNSLVYPGYNVFALEVDGGSAELIMGPRELESPPSNVLLALTPDRRLSFVVLEEQVISMFVLLSLSEGSRSWERRVVVVREGILAPPRWLRLDSFVQRSGTMVISMAFLKGKLLLNHETKEVMHICPEEEELPSPCLLYEMDLVSLPAALLKSPNSSCAASSRLSIKFGQVLATIDATSASDADVVPRKIFIGANLLNKKGKR